MNVINRDLALTITVWDYFIINFSLYFLYYPLLFADCATYFITRLMFWLQCH